LTGRVGTAAGFTGFLAAAWGIGTAETTCRREKAVMARPVSMVLMEGILIMVDVYELVDWV